jgi:hypothetical protein
MAHASRWPPSSTTGTNSSQISLIAEDCQDGHAAKMLRPSATVAAGAGPPTQHSDSVEAIIAPSFLRIDWHSESDLDAVNHDRCLESFDVRIVIEETSGEGLVLIEGARSNQ